MSLYPHIAYSPVGTQKRSDTFGLWILLNATVLIKISLTSKHTAVKKKVTVYYDTILNPFYVVDYYILIWHTNFRKLNRVNT